MTTLENATAAQLRDALAALYDAAEGADPAEFFVVANAGDNMIRLAVAERELSGRILFDVSDAQIAAEVARRGVRCLAPLTISSVRRLAGYVMDQHVQEAFPHGPFRDDAERQESIARAVRSSPLSRSDATDFVRLATGRHNGVPEQIFRAFDNATPRLDGAAGSATVGTVPPLQARAAGGVPGRGDGSGWRTVD